MAVVATNRVSAAVSDESVGMSYLDRLPRRLVVVYLPLALFVFVMLFPFYWMTVTALKPNFELTDFNNFNPFWPESPTLQHIRYLLFETSYPGWLLNTMIVAFGATFLSLIAAVFGAYAIERIRFRGSRTAGLAIFLAYLVPPSILFIPLAYVSIRFGIFDTRLALILT